MAYELSVVDQGRDDIIIGTSSGFDFRLELSLDDCTLCQSQVTDLTRSINAKEAADDPSILQNALNDLNNVGSGSITASVDPSGSASTGYTWFVTFVGDDVAGNIPTMAVDTPVLAGDTGNSLVVRTVQEGTEIAGSFRLGYTGSASIPPSEDGTTVFVPHDASTSHLADALQALSGINSGIPPTITREGPDTVNGFTWSITFFGNNGNLGDFTCDESALLGYRSGCSICVDATACLNGTFLGGSFQLEMPGYGVSRSIPASATELEFTDAVEAIPGIGEILVRRTKWPSALSPGWFGCYRWEVEFLSIPGDVPTLSVASQSLSGADALAMGHSVATLSGTQFTGEQVNIGTGTQPLPGDSKSREGNEVRGYFRLIFGGELSPVITVASGAQEMKQALIEMESLGADNSTLFVTTSLPNQANGKTWFVTFASIAGGGNIPQVQVYDANLTGVEPTISTTTVTEGNAIRGFFRLQFEGEVTGPIAYDATSAEVKSQLELLESIEDDSLFVEKHPQYDSAFQVDANKWIIEFRSNSHSGIDNPEDWDSAGRYSKAWGRNVGSRVPRIGCLYADTLRGTTDEDSSVDCTVKYVNMGSDPVGGEFRLSFNTENCDTCLVRANALSEPIRHDAKATITEDPMNSVEAILERMENIGDVSVSRGPLRPYSGGYDWHITFLEDTYVSGPCDEGTEDNLGCPNPGDVPLVEVVAASLFGSNLSTNAQEVQSGNVLRGSFALGTEGQLWTDNLPWNVSAIEMKHAIEQLPAFYNVEVYRARQGIYGQYRWEITFTESMGYIPPGAGNIPLLAVNSSLIAEGLRNTMIEVVELRAGSEGLGGQWEVSSSESNRLPRVLPFDISSERLQLELEQLEVFPFAIVKKQSYGAGWYGIPADGEEGGLRFTIYTPRSPGPVNGYSFPPGTSERSALHVKSLLTGEGVKVLSIIPPEMQGARPLEGYFKLGHGGEVTQEVPYDASAAELEDVLEQLHSIGNVVVNRKQKVQGFVSCDVKPQRFYDSIVTGKDLRPFISPGDTIAVGQIDSLDQPFLTLPGTVAVINGGTTVTTAVNLKQFLAPGSRIQIGGHEGTVDTSGAAIWTTMVTSGSGNFTDEEIRFITDEGEVTECFSIVHSILHPLVVSHELETTFGANLTIDIITTSSDVVHFHVTFMDPEARNVGKMGVEECSGSGLSIQPCPLDFYPLCTNGSTGSFTLLEPYVGQDLEAATAVLLPTVYRVADQPYEIQQMELTPGSGSFTISYGSESAQECISWGAGAEELETLLHQLSSISEREVLVTRSATSEGGWLYKIHFLDHAWSEEPPNSTIAMDFTCGAYTGTGFVTILRSGRAYSPYTQTQLPLASAQDASRPSIYSGLQTETICIFEVNGFEWNIEFSSHLGDVSPLEVFGDELEGSSIQLASIDGFTPAVLPLHTMLSSVNSGAEYFVRVFAASSHGTSAPSLIESATPYQAPTEPLDVRVELATEVPEIQSIKLAATHVDEVQEVRTTANDLPQIQSIRLMDADVFSLKFETASTNDSVWSIYLDPAMKNPDNIYFKFADRGDSTSCMTATAPETTWETSLASLAGVVRSNVHVHRSASSVHARIVFPTDLVDHGVELEVELCGLYEGVKVAIENHIQFDEPLPSNITAESLHNRLAVLPGLENVEVSRSLLIDREGFEWSLAFLSARTSYSLAICHTPNGYCEVEEDFERNMIGGDFFLRLDGQTTETISHNATAMEVDSALEALYDVQTNAVRVNRFGPDPQGGYRWHVTFQRSLGNVPEMEAISSLTGDRASVTVNKVTEGNYLEGGFSLSFKGRTTAPMVFHASAEEVQQHLEALSTIDDVAVSQSPTVSSEGGREWLVTFLGPAVKGDVPLLKASSYLSGIGASIFCREVQKGNQYSGERLKLSYGSPQSNGGLMVTQYEVRWDSSPSFSSNDFGKLVIDDVALLYRTQFISTVGDREVNGGSFVLEYGGQKTDPIPHDADDSTLRSHLESLNLIEAIDVAEDPQGSRLRLPYTNVAISSAVDVVVVNGAEALFEAGDTIWIEDRVFTVRLVSSNKVYLAVLGTQNFAYYSGPYGENLRVFKGGKGRVWRIDFVGVHGDIKPLRAPQNTLQPVGSRVLVAASDCHGCQYIHGLFMGTSYFVKVRAFNELGPGPFSRATESAPKRVPGAPQSVRLAAISNAEVEIFWNRPNDRGGGEITGYTVEWDLNPEFDSNNGAPAGKTVLSETFSKGLEPFSFVIDHIDTPVNNSPILLGMTIFVRVLAMNDVPFQDNEVWGYPRPRSVETAFQPPGVPEQFTCSVYTGQMVQCLIATPQRDGGKPVTRFEVQYSDDSRFMAFTSMELLVSTLSRLGPEGPYVGFIDGLTVGNAQFFRVRSVSENGRSSWVQMQDPGFVVPKELAPPPAEVTALPYFPPGEPVTSLNIEWREPNGNGGSRILEYLVEWWSDQSSAEVQSIRLVNSRGRSDTQGHWSVEFMGAQTGEIPPDVSAEDLRRYLMLAATDSGSYPFGNVKVDRFPDDSVAANQGYIWRVTFLSFKKDVPNMVLRSSLTSAAGSDARISLHLYQVVDGVRPEGTEEIQQIHISSVTAEPTGFFQLRAPGGTATHWLPVDIASSQLKAVLEQQPELGEVHVERNSVSTSGRFGFSWFVTFLGNLGNRAHLEIDASYVEGADIEAVVYGGNNALIDSTSLKVCRTCRPGELPIEYGSAVVGASEYSYQILGLIPGHTYSARVMAITSRGYGLPGILDSSSTLPLQKPSPPTDVQLLVRAGDNSALEVSYAAPHSNGGDEILAYRIQYSTDPEFEGPIGTMDTRCAGYRLHEIFAISTKATSDITGGTFALTVVKGDHQQNTLPIMFDAVANAEDETVIPDHVFCATPQGSLCSGNPGSIESHFEHLELLTDVTVSRQQGSTPGAYTWYITFEDDASGWDVLVSGNSLSSLNNDAIVHIERIVEGQTTESLDCTATQVIKNLVQGTPYYVRVAAYNSMGYGLPKSARKPEKPQIPPGRPTGMSLTVVSGSQLAIFFNPPRDNGGDPVVEYLIEIDSTSKFLASSSDYQAISYRQVNIGSPYKRTISGLVQGREYYVQVKARNSQGYGLPQAPTPPLEYPRQLPKSPTNVQSGVTSDTMVTVGYDIPPDNGGDPVSHFRVEWDVDSHFNSRGLGLPHKGAVDVPAGGDLFYTIKDLSSQNRYYIRVSAGNSVGFGKPTTVVPNPVQPHLAIPGKPASASIIPASQLNDMEIGLRFDDPVVPSHGLFCFGGGLDSPGAPKSCPMGMGDGRTADGGTRIRSFEVQYSQDSSFRSGVFSKTLHVDANSVAPYELILNENDGLQPAGVYYLRVAALNSQGMSMFCAKEGLLCSGTVLQGTPK